MRQKSCNNWQCQSAGSMRNTLNVISALIIVVMFNFHISFPLIMEPTFSSVIRDEARFAIVAMVLGFYSDGSLAGLIVFLVLWMEVHYAQP